jgi:hypothetical protein
VLPPSPCHGQVGNQAGLQRLQLPEAIWEWLRHVGSGSDDGALLGESLAATLRRIKGNKAADELPAVLRKWGSAPPTNEKAH